MRTNPDGTIEVRVTVAMRVDPKEWARTMMGEHPDEVLQKEVRRDIKQFVRGTITELSGAQSAHDDDARIPIDNVRVVGLYDVAPVTRRA